MIRIHVHHSGDSWWSEVIRMDPIPHTINNPAPCRTWAEAVASAERAWAVLG
ncbi:MAG TPA: hypothetical protein VIP77_22345 [Jiangellaceae bacterium]